MVLLPGFVEVLARVACAFITMSVEPEVTRAWVLHAAHLGLC